MKLHFDCSLVIFLCRKNHLRYLYHSSYLTRSLSLFFLYLILILFFLSRWLLTFLHCLFSHLFLSRKNFYLYFYYFCDNRLSLISLTFFYCLLIFLLPFLIFLAKSFLLQ